MARAGDLEKLSYAELMEMRGKIDGLLTQKKAEHVERMKAKITAELEEAGLSVVDVLGAPNRGARGPSKGSVVPPKFQNPKDPSQKWSGRGLKPKWLQQALDRGAKLDSFKIKLA